MTQAFSLSVSLSIVGSTTPEVCPNILASIFVTDYPLRESMESEDV